MVRVRTSMSMLHVVSDVVVVVAVIVVVVAVIVVVVAVIVVVVAVIVVVVVVVVVVGLVVMQVYGPGDENGLMPRAVCAAAYTKLGEKMQFLWGSDMRLNTVRAAVLPALESPSGWWMWLRSFVPKWSCAVVFSFRARSSLSSCCLISGHCA